MSNHTLFTLWGGLFILCGGLGFAQPVTGVLKGAFLILSLLFFLPPALLLRSGGDYDRKLVRSLSALSLSLTLGLLVLSLLTSFRSDALGTVLHTVLTIVSAPMVCSGYWVVSLFLWACLLMASLKNRHGS